jgi:hypothetical protein
MENSIDIVKTQAEIGRIIAEAGKLITEAEKLRAETSKLNAESAKMMRERYWYPAVVTASIIAATVAATKIFLN